MMLTTMDRAYIAFDIRAVFIKKLPGTYKIIMDNDSKEIHNPSDMSYRTDGVCHFVCFVFIV